jgi:hypothetical protein
MPNDKSPKLNTKALRKAASMPSLAHRQPDGSFDLERSEVVQWLIAQTEIRDHVFDTCRNAGAIVFENGRWRGVNHTA